ncbi:MAG TPA: AAA family ATPase [Nitratidesulfovibrio sp.]|nr:AAA family ATPase [Nitratidesulfovibrio sp.]
MKLQSLTVKNFRGIEDITINFHQRLNVFTGANGSGKSSILDCLAVLFSNCRPLTSDRLSFEDKDVRNNTSEISATIICKSIDKHYFISDIEHSKDKINSSFYETTTPNKPFQSSPQRPLSELRESIGDRLDATINFPIVAYYPTKRSYIDVPERIRGFRPSINQLDALDGALSNDLDFRSFIARFRESESFWNSTNKNPTSNTTSTSQHWHTKQIEAVRNAINAFLPEFSEIHTEYKPFRIVINKSGNTLSMLQLSDGEQCLVTMLGDLAQRLAMANPALENPLTGEGIVLIDEIDLHLHPKWQRMVIQKLLEVFPGCQFIISSHSPQILSESPKECVFILHHENNNTVCTKPEYAIGLDSSEILEALMGDSSQNKESTELLNEIFELIDDENFGDAKTKITHYKNTYGRVPKIIKAETMIKLLAE